MPIVSVVMPVFNRVTFVCSAVDSILNQTLDDFEFIIVDDGSTDDTCDEIKKYANTDNRIKLLPLPSNGGQGLARALGNDAATGRYIAVMDSDDKAMPDRLEKQVAFMERHTEVSLAGARAIKVTSRGNIEMRMAREDAIIKSRLLLVDAAFVHPTVIMRRDFLIENNLNYGAQRHGDDDYEFYNRMVEAGAVFGNMEDVVLEYHRHGANITQTIKGHEANKLPLKRFLLTLYYPDLTSREIGALAVITQRNFSCSLKKAVEGLLAGEKAARMMESQYGEDRGELEKLVRWYMRRVEKHMNTIPGRG